MTRQAAEMVENKTWVNKLVSGALRETIIAHGPITRDRIGSAAKRIAGRITGEIKAANKED
jgi:hypothetical protein